jgi:thioredoxin-like negative regulator of GroEL
VAEQQEQAAPDAMMTRIGQVVMLHHGGDREEARGRFLDLWGEIGEDGDPLHRCTLAHYLADTQDDPADELAWDLRALSAAEELTDGVGVEPHQSLAARAFYPSLHLNLAADYVKLGRSEAARSHLRRARGAVGALGDDRYGDGVRAAIGRLELRLDGDGPSDGASGEGPGTVEGPGPFGGPGSFGGPGFHGGPGGETLGPPRQRP